MKIRPIVYVVPLVILTIALAFGSPLLLRVFFFLLTVGIAGFAWAAFGLRGLRLKPVDVPNDCRVGGRFKEEITVANDSKLPKLMLKAEEDTSLPGDSNVAVISLSPGASQSWQRTGACRLPGRSYAC